MRLAHPLPSPLPVPRRVEAARRRSGRPPDLLERCGPGHPQDRGAEVALDALLHRRGTISQLEKLVQLVGRHLGLVALPEAVWRPGGDRLEGDALDEARWERGAADGFVTPMGPPRCARPRPSSGTPRTRGAAQPGFVLAESSESGLRPRHRFPRERAIVVPSHLELARRRGGPRTHSRVPTAPMRIILHEHLTRAPAREQPGVTVGLVRLELIPIMNSGSARPLTSKRGAGQKLPRERVLR